MLRWLRHTASRLNGSSRGAEQPRRQSSRPAAPALPSQLPPLPLKRPRHTLTRPRTTEASIGPRSVCVQRGLRCVRAPGRLLHPLLLQPPIRRRLLAAQALPPSPGVAPRAAPYTGGSSKGSGPAQAPGTGRLQRAGCWVWRPCALQVHCTGHKPKPSSPPAAAPNLQLGLTAHTNTLSNKALNKQQHERETRQYG